MNREPHVHEVEIRREYRNINSGDLLVTYGDTTIVALYDTPLFGLHERRARVKWLNTNPAKAEQCIRTAVEKAIKQHDEGSQRALDLDELGKALTPVEPSW